MACSSAYISRNPFAREELRRRSVTTSGTCGWCGGTRKNRKLFQYVIETDGGRKFEINGLFCSISCMRTYHNVEE